jgi:hypothetical protein
MGGRMLFRQADFPNLHPGNYRDTSPLDRRYNCIAWAAGVDCDWWGPENSHHWPGNAPRNYQVASLILVFESVGFAICADGLLEDGFEKIAIFADGEEYTHAARQLEDGKWTSKMGPDEDIVHDAPENLAGPCYGNVSAYMKRERLQGGDAAFRIQCPV